jgi:hypothetical protein
MYDSPSVHASSTHGGREREVGVASDAVDEGLVG